VLRSRDAALPLADTQGAQGSPHAGGVVPGTGLDIELVGGFQLRDRLRARRQDPAEVLAGSRLEQPRVAACGQLDRSFGGLPCRGGMGADQRPGVARGRRERVNLRIQLGVGCRPLREGLCHVAVAGPQRELAIGYPISGGLVRWPQLAGGPFIGALTGGAAIAVIVVGGAVESSAIFQYVSHWWPAVFDSASGQLTWIGIGMYCAAIAVFTGLNLLAIRYVGALNMVLSVAKWVIPILTAALLLASGFHGGNFTAHGGFAPYGASSVLSVVTTGGILFTLGGFYIAQTVAGEVKDPRTVQTRGTLIGGLSAFVVYLLLQLAFIAALPSGMLAHAGWHGLTFSSPFAQLAVLVNLGWLSTVLVVDAVLSPSASALIGTAMFGRNIYGIAQNRTLPGSFRAVTRNGTPMRALVLSAALSICSLIVLRSWHSIVALLGAYFAFGYAAASLALGCSSALAAGRTGARGYR
jgi:amino acid transporter